MQPKDILTDSEVYISQPASKGKRFANLFIDSIIMYIFILPLMFLFMPSGEEIMNDPEYLDSGSFLGMIYLIYFFVFFTYYTLLEYFKGQTVGKMITKTKVVDNDGHKPTLKDAFVRTLCRLIPFEPFSLLFGDEGWHDRVAGTSVVSHEVALY